MPASAEPEKPKLTVTGTSTALDSSPLIVATPPFSANGEPVEVRAEVHTLNGFSGHAGQTDLLRWFGALVRARPRVALVHGDDRPRDALAAVIRECYDLAPERPVLGDTLEW